MPDIISTKFVPLACPPLDKQNLPWPNAQDDLTSSCSSTFPIQTFSCTNSASREPLSSPNLSDQPGIWTQKMNLILGQQTARHRARVESPAKNKFTLTKNCNWYSAGTQCNSPRSNEKQDHEESHQSIAEADKDINQNDDENSSSGAEQETEMKESLKDPEGQRGFDKGGGVSSVYVLIILWLSLTTKSSNMLVLGIRGD